MSNPQEGSSISRKSVWDRDLDNPAEFEVDIRTVEEMEGAGSSKDSKPKKPRTAHEKDPDYPPPRYTVFAYKVGLQWYEDKTAAVLEKRYLRHKEAGMKKLKNDLQDLITKKCQDSVDYADVYDLYYNQWHTWMANCLQSCIFNTQKLMLDFRPQVPGFPENEEAKEFREKMDWWRQAARRLSKHYTRGLGWQTDALKAQLSRDGASCLS